MMEKLHLFSTRRMRERMDQVALRTKIADFQAAQVAMRIAQVEAAAMSAGEKSEAQSRSSAERRRCTPAV
jgi:hypothetical protein